MHDIQKLSANTSGVWYESSCNATDILHNFLAHHQHTLAIAHTLPHTVHTFLTEKEYNYQAESKQKGIGLTFFRIWHKSLTHEQIQERIKKQRVQTIAIFFYSRDESSVIAYRVYAELVLQHYTRHDTTAHIAICDVNNKSSS